MSLNLNEMLGNENFHSEDLDNDELLLSLDSDMDELGTECYKYESALGLMDEIQTGLESLYDQMQVSNERGGMTDREMSFALGQLGFMEKVTGLKLTANMPAVESFSDADGRRSSTLIAMEAGIKETLKNWWEKMKTMVVKFYKIIKDFFIKHLSFTGILNKRARWLKEKAAKAGDLFKNQTVTISEGTYKKIQVNGQKVDVKKLAGALTQTATLVKIKSAQTISGSSTIGADLQEVVVKAALFAKERKWFSGVDKENRMVGSAEAVLPANAIMTKAKVDSLLKAMEFEPNNKGIRYNSGDDKTEYWQSAFPTFGDKRIFININEKEYNGQTVVVQVEKREGVYDAHKPSSSDLVFGALKSAEIVSILDGVIAVTDAILNAKFDPDKIAAKNKKFFSDIDPVIKEAASAASTADTEDKKMVMHYLRMARVISALVLEPGAFMNKVSYAGASGCFDVAKTMYQNCTTK